MERIEKLCLIENVIQRLSIAEKLALAGVSKYLYGLSRSDFAWQRDKNRVLVMFPELDALFDAYKGTKERNIVPHESKSKRQKRAVWITPKGTWYVFARFLLGRTLDESPSLLSLRLNKNSLPMQSLMMAHIRGMFPPGVIESCSLGKAAPVTVHLKFRSLRHKTPVSMQFKLVKKRIYPIGATCQHEAAHNVVVDLEMGNILWSNKAICFSNLRNIILDLPNWVHRYLINPDYLTQL